MDSKNNLKALSAIGFSDIIGTGATAFFWFYLASLINPDQYGEIFFYLELGSAMLAVSHCYFSVNSNRLYAVGERLQPSAKLHLSYKC